MDNETITKIITKLEQAQEHLDNLPPDLMARPSVLIDESIGVLYKNITPTLSEIINTGTCVGYFTVSYIKNDPEPKEHIQRFKIDPDNPKIAEQKAKNFIKSLSTNTAIEE